MAARLKPQWSRRAHLTRDPEKSQNPSPGYSLRKMSDRRKEMTLQRQAVKTLSDLILVEGVQVS